MTSKEGILCIAIIKLASSRRWDLLVWGTRHIFVLSTKGRDITYKGK